ncbi:MAG: aminopeptidase [Mariniphaga sp.]|nr:aminopeptidase [Mariniphaga sp.]
MKNLRWVFSALMVFFVCISVSAKKGDTEGAVGTENIIEDVNVLPNTSVKDQARTSTCWAFATLSLFESELLRLGKPEVDLSEMFVVWHTYSEKAQKHVRLQGNSNFSAGGAFHDVTNMIRKYGIVPESVYDGLNNGNAWHVHGEMDKVLKKYIEGVVANKNTCLSTDWHEGIESTLDSYLGETPLTFEYNGAEYTPQAFASEYIGLDMDDYVEISSYTHHPFYSNFILEVPDNWSWDEVYNVPVNEMQEIIDNSLENGYTVAWASDISEKGFSTRKLGMAVVNDEAIQGNFQSNQDGTVQTPEGFSETPISQEMRQFAFDNYQTTDDHGMHIVGLANDQNGNEFYKIKNSWGNYNKFDGFFYTTKEYVNYKTTCIMVHKDAIPKNIREKLNL